MVQHGFGETAYDGDGAGVEVAEHGIGPPSSHETDEVRVDFCCQQGHGTARTEPTSLDVFHVKSAKGDTTGHLSQKGRNHSGGDVVEEALSCGCVRAKGSFRACSCVSKGDYAANQRACWAHYCITTEGMGDYFTLVAILLVVKGDGRSCCFEQFGFRAIEDVKLADSDADRNVAAEKWIVVMCEGKFTGAEQVEKTDPCQFHGCLCFFIQSTGGDSLCSAKKLKWYGLYTGRRRVFVAPACQQALEADVDGAEFVKPWVRGPHMAKRFCNGVQLVSHGISGRAGDCGCIFHLVCELRGPAGWVFCLRWQQGGCRLRGICKKVAKSWSTSVVGRMRVRV